MRLGGSANRSLTGKICPQDDMLMISRLLVLFLCMVLLTGPIPSICWCCHTADTESHKNSPKALLTQIYTHCDDSGRTCCRMPSSERMGCCNSADCVPFDPTGCNCCVRGQNPDNQGTPPPKALEKGTSSNRLLFLTAIHSNFSRAYLARGTTSPLFEQSPDPSGFAYHPLFLLNYSILC